MGEMTIACLVEHTHTRSHIRDHLNWTIVFIKVSQHIYSNKSNNLVNVKYFIQEKQ